MDTPFGGDDQLNNGAGGDTPSPDAAAAAEFNRRLRENKLRGAAAPSETTTVHRDNALTVQPSIRPGKEPGWGSKLWDFAKSATTAGGKTAVAASRGVTDAVDEGSNSVVGLGAGIVHGAIHAARATGVADSHFGSDWEAWYNAGHLKDINPLQIGEDNKDALFGDKQGGVYGFVEDASAIATGFLAGGAALKSVGLSAGALEAAKAGKGAITAARAAQGAIADGAFFDPYKKRLSNMIENAPPAIQYPITQLLQAHDDDNEAVARLKSALEGVMTGVAIDKFIGVLKVAKPWFRGAGAGVETGIQKAAAAQEAAVAKVAESAPEAVAVHPVGDGTFRLEHNAPVGDPALAAKVESPVFESLADAESHAAAMNTVVADKQLPRASIGPEQSQAVLDRMNVVRDAINGKLTGDQMKQYGLTNAKGLLGRGFNESGIVHVADLLKDPLKMSDWITDGLHLNVSFTQTEPEVNAMVSELANQLQEAFTGARGRQADGLGTTFAELADGGRKLAQEGDPNSWADSGFRDAEMVDEATYRQMARRVVSNSLAKTTYRLARALDANPANAIARDNFSQSLNHMANVGTGQEAVASAFGRGLGSHRASALADAVVKGAKADGAQGVAATVSDAVKTEAKGALGEVRTARQAVADASEKAAKEKGNPTWQQLMPDAKTAQLARAWKRAESAVKSALKEHPELQSWADEMKAHGKMLDDALKQTDHAGGNATPGGVMKDVPGVVKGPQPGAKKLLSTLMGALDETDAKLANLQRGVKTPAQALPKEVTDIAQLAKKQTTAEGGDVVASNPTYIHDVLDGLAPEDIQLARERMKAEAIIAKSKKGAPDVPHFDTQGPRTAEQQATLEDLRRNIVEKAKAQRENPLVPSEAEHAAAKEATVPAPQSDMERAMNAILDEPSNYPQPHRIGNAEVSPLQPKAQRPLDVLRDLLNKSDMRSLARQIVLNEGDPALMIDAMLGQARVAGDPSKWERFNTYRANAMLSGPRTFFVNAISNAVASVQMPAEYWMAGRITGNSGLRRQGWEMAAGIFHNYRQSWAAMKKAWASGENALDTAASQIGDSGQSVSSDLTSGNWLQRFAKAPSRSLMAADEFFKNLNYLNAVRGLSVRQSVEQGITDAGEIASRLADDIHTSTTMNGRALNPIALQYARTATFQNPLEYGIGQGWQRLVQDNPALRVITPFVRTPVNLARFAWQRTPVLGALQRQMMEDMAAGGERRALALAKQGIGAAVWGTAGWYAAHGHMTGMGPRDPMLRRQQKEAGIEPYSIRIPGTDTWVSYRRLDPLGTALGVVADIVQMSGELHEHETQDAAAKFMAALSADVTNKTFLSSLSDVMEAISSGDPNKWQKWFFNIEGSVMPFGSFVRQVNPDDHWREVRGHVDNIASRVPLWSESLEPRRNILGKPVAKPPGYLNAALNPFTVTFGGDVNPLQDELVQLGKSMPMPDTNLEGEDLTDRSSWKPTSGKDQSPYDRWLELVDKPTYGKPLEQQLHGMMQTDAWKNASSGHEYYPGGLKYRMASTIITNAYDVAKQTMLQEYPTLQRQLIGKRAAATASLSSSPTLVDKLEAQFGVKH